MVAYHFPPLAGSSGIQRTLRFVQHLPAFGWQPLVLTVHPRAYERTSDDLMGEVPPGTVVRRAFALDTARHLSIAGRYLSPMALPDRWVSWRFDGVRAGMELIRRWKPDALWSTYPIATAHLIAAELQRRSGLPWIADFRDPMVEADYPREPALRARCIAIEAATVQSARMCLLTTPGAVAEYQARHPAQAGRIALLENGYDEESFADAERRVAGAPLPQTGPRVLLHSGIVYPEARDPTQLFAALRQLHDRGDIRPGQLLVRMRAAVHEDVVQALARAQGVEAYVELAPPIGYIDALAEMLTVDGLLVLQDSNCNQQVPAKLYEYMRAGRPVLALTDPAGDTAAVLRNVGISRMARLNDAGEIASLVMDVLRAGNNLRPRPSDVSAASRRERTAGLAQWLDAVSDAR